MGDFSLVKHYATQYYGIDWAVIILCFIAIFLLDEKKRQGFVFGMLASLFGIIFSFQIKSIANGLSSLILFCLYLRGYVLWHKRKGKLIKK